MPLRAQYISDVSIGPATYPGGALSRVKDIYRTARRGQIGQPLANRMWAVLQPVYQRAVSGKLPTNQTAFDQFVVSNALQIQAILQRAHRGGFGIGQKVVNLFLKDLWALGIIQMPVERLLHAPIDRIVLDKIANRPITWKAWTKVAANGPRSQEVIGYLTIQQQLRNYQRACPIALPSLIQMEQFIWHRI